MALSPALLGGGSGPVVLPPQVRRARLELRVDWSRDWRSRLRYLAVAGSGGRRPHGKPYRFRVGLFDPRSQGRLAGLSNSGGGGHGADRRGIGVSRLSHPPSDVPGFRVVERAKLQLRCAAGFLGRVRTFAWRSLAGRIRGGSALRRRVSPPRENRRRRHRACHHQRIAGRTGPVLTPLVSLVGRIRRQDEQDPPGRFVPHNYSYRSATMGSIFVARLAGIKNARDAAATSARGMETNVAASFAVTPNTSDAIRRAKNQAMGSPTTSPAPMVSMPRRKTMASTFWRSAPSAMRMPISWVCSETM